MTNTALRFEDFGVPGGAAVCMSGVAALHGKAMSAGKVTEAAQLSKAYEAGCVALMLGYPVPYDLISACSGDALGHAAEGALALTNKPKKSFHASAFCWAFAFYRDLNAINRGMNAAGWRSWANTLRTCYGAWCEVLRDLSEVGPDV